MNAETFLPISRGAFSTRLARGLRRDVFRNVGDQVTPRHQVLLRTIKSCSLPCPNAKERLRIWDRAVRAVRGATFAFKEGVADGNLVMSGVSMSIKDVYYENGPCEKVLALGAVNALLEEPILFAMIDIGSISQHAIERMFERIVTTDKKHIMRELTIAARWMHILRNRCFQRRQDETVHQLIVPCHGGNLLCTRDPSTGEIHARTWVNRGTKRRHDESADALEAWLALKAGNQADAFEAMLAAPANAWFRQPRQQGGRN